MPTRRAVSCLNQVPVSVAAASTPPGTTARGPPKASEQTNGAAAAFRSPCCQYQPPPFSAPVIVKPPGQEPRTSRITRPPSAVYSVVVAPQVTRTDRRPANGRTTNPPEGPDQNGAARVQLVGGGPSSSPGGPLQTALPFVPDTPEHVLPVYLLNTNRSLLEHGGNRAVPLPWRFWYEALLSAPIGAYGSEAVIAPTVADLVAFAGWARFQRYRHIPELAGALETLDRMAIPYRGTAWRPVLVRNIPASNEIISTPSSSSRSSSRPAVARGRRSTARRFDPSPRGPSPATAASSVSRRIGGQGRGGADAMADNPEADRWPVLTPETLRLILFPAGRDNPNTERSDRKRAVAHVKSMEAEGIVEMVPAGAGWRVYRSRP